VVAAGEQQVQRVRRALESADQMFLVRDSSVEHHGRQLEVRLRVTMSEVEDDEPLHLTASRDQHRSVGHPRPALGGVVLRDRAAHDDARVQGNVGERRVEDGATDVVEVQVHTLGAGRSETLGEPRFA